MREKIAVIVTLLLAACPPPTAGSDGGSGTGSGSSGSSGLSSGSSSSGGPLKLISVTPSSGPLAGGTKVAIAGDGFASGIEITFGGLAAQSISLVSAAQLTAVTPAGSQPGPTDVVASLNGQTASLDGGFSYGASPPIDYCILQFPKSLDAAPETSAGPVYGRVYVPNLTTASGNQSQIEGEAGWGTLGSVPDSTWSWSPAVFNPSCSGCGNNYEYDSMISTGATGSYALAFRFSTDNGATWTNCDAAGDTAPATYSPANQGTLTVSVSDGGADGGSDGGLSIGYCDLQFPQTLDSAPGVLAGPVYGRVYVPGLTDSSGNPALILGQVGYGPTGSTPPSSGADGGAWTWAPTAYNASCNGCGNNYEYDGTFTAPGPGSYALAFRFSLDNGAHFVDCDAAGDSPYNPSNAGILTVELADAGVDAGLSIGWCDLQFPTSLDGTSGTPLGPVYGRVYVAGLTDSSGNPALIEGQVGYGPTGSTPASDGGWSWSATTYNTSCTGCGNNYEYDGTLTGPAPGTYALAFRFSLDHGASFVDCDANGDSPYNPANEGTLTASLPPVDAGPGDAGSQVDAGPLFSIGWCDLQFPTTLDGTTGSSAGPVYGRVYVAGLTDSGGDAGEILAQVGFGPLGGDPATVDAGWRWAVSTFNPLCSGCGNNYEYEGTLTAPSPGNYALAYRFSVDQGATFTDCDAMGDVPYNPEFSGQFDVGAPVVDAGVDAGADAGSDGGSDAGPVGTDAGPDAGQPDAGTADAGQADAGTPDAGPAPIPIQYCDLQFPTALTLEPGANSGLVYAQVYSGGVTTVAGNQSELLAQVGYGPAGSDPAAPDAGWSWTAAGFNASCLACGNNYEYEAAFAAPGVGSYAMAARFSGDQGASWTNCDAAGDAVYNPANAGTLTVQWIAVGWCNVQFPPTLTGAAGVDAGPIYGQVYWAGVTNNGGNPASILAEVGLGPTGSDPTLPDAGWSWWPAVYNPSCLDCGNNFEYFGYVVPAAAGSFDYVTRFSADDGGYWTACSLDGPWVEGGVNDAGVLTVP